MRHTHGTPTESLVASGIYYPTATRGSAPVKFFLGGSCILEVVPEADRIILFPCDLPHEVAPSGAESGSAARISYAFNLHVRWLSLPIFQLAATEKINRCNNFRLEEALDVEVPEPVLGFRAMHLAAEAGHLAVVQALTRLRAETDTVSNVGQSPLALAAERGHVEVASYLIQSHPETWPSKPALIGGVLLHTGKSGAQSAFQMAATRGHAAVAGLLLNSCPGLDTSGAYRSVVDAGHSEVLQTLLNHAGLPCSPSFLHISAKRGHIGVTDSLIRARANLSDRDEGGLLPIHIAACEGHLSLVEALLMANASVDREKRHCTGDNYDDEDAVMISQVAEKNGHDRIVAWLSSKHDRLGRGDNQ